MDDGQSSRNVDCRIQRLVQEEGYNSTYKVYGPVMREHAPPLELNAEVAALVPKVALKVPVLEVSVRFLVSDGRVRVV